MLARFECGKIAPEEFAAELMTLTGLDLPYHEFVDAWQDIFSLNEPVALLIERLAGQVTLCSWVRTPTSCTRLISGANSRRHWTCSHFVLSHEVGHMKPGNQFYEACVAAAGLPASSCIFVDDLLENVEGARRAGLVGLHYVAAPDLISDLARLVWKQSK